MPREKRNFGRVDRAEKTARGRQGTAEKIQRRFDFDRKIKRNVYIAYRVQYEKERDKAETKLEWHLRQRHWTLLSKSKLRACHFSRSCGTRSFFLVYRGKSADFSGSMSFLDNVALDLGNSRKQMDFLFVRVDSAEESSSSRVFTPLILYEEGLARSRRKTRISAEQYRMAYCTHTAFTISNGREIKFSASSLPARRARISRPRNFSTSPRHCGASIDSFLYYCGSWRYLAREEFLPACIRRFTCVYVRDARKGVDFNGETINLESLMPKARKP